MKRNLPWHAHSTVQTPQVGFDPPIAISQYHTEWDIDALTIQATTAVFIYLLDTNKAENLFYRCCELNGIDQSYCTKNISFTYICDKHKQKI